MAAAVVLLSTVGFVANSNSSNDAAQADVAAVVTVPAVPVFDATRHDDRASRSYVRGHNCPDLDACVAVAAPVMTAKPSVVKKVTHPVHHKPAHKVKKTTERKTSSSHHKSHSESNGPSVSSGGGGSCAPSVSLPSKIVKIVHKHLSGCKAAALLWIIKHESGGNVHARNKSSGAYGIPQALPGSKMASAGSDWRDNPDTQIRWMISYTNRYGGPVGAYHFWRAHGWY